MKYFAGLDVSLEETAICVVDESGRIVKETRAVSEPQALSDALRKVDLPLERVGLVSAGVCEEPAMPHLALSPGRPSHGAERDAFDRERGASDAARGRRQARHAVAHRLC